jgi:hypothetical protein
LQRAIYTDLVENIGYLMSQLFGNA